jgi:hypothetical protein
MGNRPIFFVRVGYGERTESMSPAKKTERKGGEER